MAHDKHHNPSIDRTVVASDNDDRNSTMRKSQLLHLKDTDDFEIADGEPDVRGWDVRSSDGRKLGEVEDLLVDTDAMRVRYVEVHLDKDVVGDDDKAPRYALVPVGAAQLDNEDDNVIVDLAAANIPALPAYKRGSVDRSYESSLVDRYRSNRDNADLGQRSGRSESDDFYGGLQFDEDRFWGTRRRGRETTPYIRSRTRS